MSLPRPGNVVRRSRSVGQGGQDVPGYAKECKGGDSFGAGDREPLTPVPAHRMGDDRRALQLRGIEHRGDRFDGEVVEIDRRVIHSIAESPAGAVEYQNAAAGEMRQQGDEGEAIASISRHDDDGIALARLGYARPDSVPRKHDIADCVRDSVEVVEFLLGGLRSRDARIVFWRQATKYSAEAYPILGSN
jgi:hypothetical protein